MNNIEPKFGSGRPVFSDPHHKRARIVGAFVLILASGFIAWIAYFVVTIYVLDEAIALRERQLKQDASQHAAEPVSALLDAPPYVTPDRPVCGAKREDAGGALSLAPLTSAYLRVWPDGAVNSIAANCAYLDGVYLEWFRADLAQGAVLDIGSADVVRRLADNSQRNGGALQINAVAALPLPTLPAAAGDARRNQIDRTTAALTRVAAENGISRFCVSPERFRAEHTELLQEFLEAFGSALARIGVKSCLIAEATGPLWRNADLVASVDFLVLQAFALPFAGSKPAPLSPQGWFTKTVEEALGAIGDEKLVVALGSFGALWRGGTARPRILGFSDAMLLAHQHGGSVDLAERTLNTHIQFRTETGAASEIWLLDAISVRNQLTWIAAQGVREVTLWTAGLEDPGLWELFDLDPLPMGQFSQDLIIRNSVAYQGKGPFMRLSKPARAGRRILKADPETSRLVDQEYEIIPTPIVLQRYGAKDEKLFALTFDDGPDPDFTSEILDTLREKDVPAAFFVIGTNVARAPAIARRIVAEGHDLGSHTLFHPATENLSDYRLEFELEVSQRLLVSTTGRGTTLFRSPYGSSAGPVTLGEARSIMRIQDAGYAIAGADIVTRDWEALTAEQIVNDVIAQLDPSGGSQVLVLHDAGGDRQPTVDALPVLIDRLRALGYSFVSLHELVGAERDDLMPPYQTIWSKVDQVSFAFITASGRAVQWIFWFAVGYGVMRTTAVLVLAHVRRPHRGPETSDENLGPVTILIPAFNEEASIATTVTSALASDFQDLSIIVIDDGSTDRTAEIVEAVAQSDPRVTIIRQENRGKWRALDTAYRLVDTEIVVAIDADTRLAQDAVTLLVRHFADPEVGAVAGNVRVANRGHLLTRLQALEYITAQNLDRRAAEALNAILVVPGAIGAWRVEAVRRAGYYVNDTITEDADLTVSVNRAGYRVVFEEAAMSFTRVPKSTRMFLRQRLRWVFGMMQTAWKHRAAAREGRAVGLVAIPDLWLFGVGFGLLAPVADLVFIAVLIDAAAGGFFGGSLSITERQAWMLAGYLALPGLDLIAILLALRFERSESKSLALLLPFQRIFYRPLFYFTVYRAVWHSVFGRLVGWGRQRRPAALQAP